jgi:glycosyltransferase involved in cell wall biosynthesis
MLTFISLGIFRKKKRDELGIPTNATVFLCIGFIQPHKGYDRAVQAFKSVTNEKMHLYIVGSLRIQWDVYIDYLEKLKNTAVENSQIHVVERYLSDEDFDTWIIACDVMVIPYREIWSSGVLGRAKLFNKKVVASNVGGLAEQLEENDILFNTDEELKEIFNEFGNSER